MDISLPLEFSHASLRLAFDPRTGDWTSFFFRGDNLMTRGARSGFALTVDGVDSAGWTLKSHNVMKLPAGSEVVLEYACADFPDLRAWQIFDLYGDSGRVERWLHLAARPNSERRINASVLWLEGLTAGDPQGAAATVVNCPFIPAELPHVGADPVRFDGFPDPLLTISRPDPALHVAVIPSTEDASATLQLSLGPSGSMLAEYRWQCAAAVDGDETVTVAEQIILVQNRPWQAAMQQAGKLQAQRSVEPQAWRGDRIAGWLCDRIGDNSLDGSGVQRLLGDYVLSLPPGSKLKMAAAACPSPASAPLSSLLDFLSGGASGDFRFPAGYPREICAVQGAEQIVLANFSSRAVSVDAEARRQVAPWHAAAG